MIQFSRPLGTAIPALFPAGCANAERSEARCSNSVVRWVRQSQHYFRPCVVRSGEVRPSRVMQFSRLLGAVIPAQISARCAEVWLCAARRGAANTSAGYGNPGTFCVVRHVSITDLANASSPYLRFSSWVKGAYIRWRLITACAAVNLVISNGIEVSAKSFNWGWLSTMVDGSGISWKAAIVQAILHSIWAGAAHIAGRKTVES